MADEGDQLLRETTRRERKVLVATSAIGIAMVTTGVIPTRIAALGVEFAPTEQRAVLFAAMAAIIYFLVGFVIYAADDFLFWKLRGLKSYRTALQDIFVNEEILSLTNPPRPDGLGMPLEHRLDDRVLRALADRKAEEQTEKLWRPWQRLSLPVVVVRVLFEFIFPVGLATWSIVALYLRATSMPVG